MLTKHINIIKNNNKFIGASYESNQNKKSNEINIDPNNNPDNPKSAKGILYNQSLM